jgi:4-diphosphocytidyl-2-C-methyl-D-erythritol kinase
LEIVGRRPDGFHEIVSVTQTISLADQIEAAPSDDLDVEMEPPLVGAEVNLARRAAVALARATGRAPSGHLRIAKSIPLAAGLGGGSSDAAAALRLLDRLWGTGLGPHRLALIAATLGSDVPLFLTGGLSRLRGRGEIVEPIEPAQPFWLLLIVPGGAPPDKTRTLYQALRPADFSRGAATLALCNWLRSGGSIASATMVNGFDAAASRVYPGLAALRGRLTELIGRPVHLSGAGPTLFAIFDSTGEARRAASRVSILGFRTLIARSIAGRPPIRRV